jgi:hypothetical protein
MAPAERGHLTTLIRWHRQGFRLLWRWTSKLIETSPTGMDNGRRVCRSTTPRWAPQLLGPRGVIPSNPSARLTPWTLLESMPSLEPSARN